MPDSGPGITIGDRDPALAEPTLANHPEQIHPSTGVSTNQNSKADTTETAVQTDPALQLSRIFVVMPAYNEGESLQPLLTRIARIANVANREIHTVVVNDGSQDNTLAVARSFQNRMPLTVVDHGVNKGFGAAMKSAISKAHELAMPDDIIVTMDADNTQPPESIHHMVDLLENGYDVIIASRYRTGARVVGVPFLRNIYSLGARALFTCLFPTKGVRDYTCGYRAFRAEVIQQAFQQYGDKFFSESGFTTTVDILLKIRKLDNIQFFEVPMVLRYDKKGGVSKMNVGSTIRRTLGLVFSRRFKSGK